MEDLKKYIINVIDTAIVQGKGIVVSSTSESFRFYTDTCGQRGATLKIQSYSIPKYKDRDLNKGRYTINRVLSFVNPIDEGKDDAILGEIDVNKFDNVSVFSTDRNLIITLDFIEIRMSR